MRHKKKGLVLATILFTSIIAFVQCSKDLEDVDPALVNNQEQSQSSNKHKSLIDQGKDIFRYDTFGDEEFWSGLLHIDKAIAGANNGGFGPGVSPLTALSVGLKVDAEALPPEVVVGIQSGAVDLNDPATTLELIKLDAYRICCHSLTNIMKADASRFAVTMVYTICYSLIRL